MLLVFTYYDAFVKQDFMRAMKFFSSIMTPIIPNRTLVILSDVKPSDREVQMLNTMFDAVSVVRPTTIPSDDTFESLANARFTETLLYYSAYDRIYIDPRMVLVNKFDLPTEASLFFKQHFGNLSTKLVYLKGGNQFSKAFSILHGGRRINNVTEKEFTYVIYNNFLIKKQIDGKHIMNGKLFDSSGFSDLPLTNQVAIDMTGVMPDNHKMAKLIESVGSSLNQSPKIFLSGIKKKNQNKGSVPFSNVSIVLEKGEIVSKPVSFCIPAYKSEEFIEECLDSIYAQNCEKEILIGIDACESTLLKVNQIKHKYDNLRVFWFPKNVGPYVIKNTLAQKSKYEILSFFDADDIMDPGYTSIGLSNLVKNSIFRIKYADFSKGKAPVDMNYHAHGIMLIHKDDFLAVNGFYGIRVAADLDFLNRWANGGNTDIKFNGVLMRRRVHDKNISFSSETGMNTPYRNKIHADLEQRKASGLVKNDTLEIADCSEIHSSNEPISFCVPAYRAKDYIEECLDSIETQNCPKEILVGVDGCEETLAAVKKIRTKYNNLRIFWFKKNSGTSLVKNTLATFAKNNILSFFDADDIMEPNYADQVLQNITDRTIIRFRFRNFNHDDPARKLTNRNFCANGAMSIYREKFIKMNGFWDHRVSEDMDFIERWKVNNIDNQLSVYGFKRRIHSHNISYDEKTGCYGDFGKKLAEQSATKIKNGIVVNPYLPVAKCEELECTINSYFDHVYCLNLERRPDKWKTVKKRFDRLGIEIERFSAVDGNNLEQSEIDKHPKLNKYEIGCMLSHYRIIQDAKKNGYRRILIFEDDVLFAKHFKTKFSDKISKLPKWKIFYLGATQWIWKDVKFLDDFYLANRTDSTFAYAVDASMYDEFLQTEDVINRPIDNKLFDIQQQYEGSCYVSFPNLVIADVSNSDIRNSRENKDHQIKMKWNLDKYE